MKNRLFIISVIAVYFYSGLVLGDDVVDAFVNKFKPDLLKEYKYIIDNKRPSKSLSSFIIEVTNYWKENYNNNPVSLSDGQCAFWLALTGIKASHETEFSGDSFEYLSYYYSLLIEDNKIEARHRKTCRAWINKSIRVSIIDLKHKGLQFEGVQLEGRIVSLVGVLYNKESENFSALYLTREHFRSVDLSNAVGLVNRAEIDTNLHGKLVRIEGRLLSYKKGDITTNYLHFGRVVQTYE